MSVLGDQICSNSDKQVTVVPQTGVKRHTFNRARRAEVLTSPVLLFAFGHDGIAFFVTIRVCGNGISC